MSSVRAVDPDTFREALAPLVAAIRDFTVAVDDVAPRHGNVAWEDSPAMREIQDERKYAKPSSWTGPISDTHALGELTLRAAADYVRTFAEAFAAQRLPLYGHLVAARSALESSVISWWLSEPDIARDERVKRGLSEYLYSATEEGWLELRDDAAEQVDDWVGRAAKLGWEATDRNGKPWSLTKSRGKPLVDGVGRPSIPAGIRRLLVSDEESRIGKLQWSRLSAVSHVTWFGLRSALMLEDSAPNIATGLSTVPVGNSSSAVIVQALCITKALRQAASARFALMGWQDEEWRTACRVAQQHEVALLRRTKLGNPCPTSRDWGPRRSTPR
jgi:hypothetical protein